MRTINIPDFTYNSILAAIYQTADSDAKQGWLALSDRGYGIAEEIARLNGGASLDSELPPGASPDARLPTGVSIADDGCVCHCDQRDPEEIAVYYTEDELLAVQWALHRVTFGDLDDDVSVIDLHRAARETDDVIRDRVES